MNDASWHVYIVRCSDDTLYTGVARNLQQRIAEHNEGKRGARYTRARRPVELLYHEPAVDRSSAQQREHQIKQMSRRQKLQLVERHAQA